LLLLPFKWSLDIPEMQRQCFLLIAVLGARNGCHPGADHQLSEIIERSASTVYTHTVSRVLAIQ
jgi:hypothetical protein